MKYKIALLAFCYFAFAKAQLESSHWYFGQNAGIDFVDGVAVPTDDGSLITGEGCASISDSSGNLLFYTDGSLVFNKNHQLMPNGGSLNGNSSSTSSAIIVPQPGNENRFFVFTVDTDDFFYRRTRGLQYSVVDMSLDNNLGDVDPAEQNILLRNLTSEKLTAVANRAGNGYWMITQFEDRFFAYSITSSGLNLIPVTSQQAPFIELITTPFSNVDVPAMRGYMKVNARGNKLVAAHFSNYTTADFVGITSIIEARNKAYGSGGELYVYDFDNETGIVSNAQPLMTRASGGSFYGIEYSGNGKYLYAAVDYFAPSVFITVNFQRGEIVRFDLSAPDIAASKTTIYNDAITQFRGAMQLGLDNRIYHSRLGQPALSVIENPDDDNGVSYMFNDFDLLPNTEAQYGLPIFVQSFLGNGSITGTDHCFGTEEQFSLTTSAVVESIVWDFDDVNSGNSNSSTTRETSHLFSAPGTYTITARVTTLVNTFTVSRTVIVYEAVSVNTTPLNLVKCDEGFNTATFNLTVTLSQLELEVAEIASIHNTYEDALNNANPLIQLTNYRNLLETETLFIRVSNRNCSAIIPLHLKVENCDVIVNNVLTPNDDGANDFFFIQGLRNVYENHTVEIYSRYGQKIWQGDNETEPWNGFANTGLTPTSNRLPTGTYYYIINFNEADKKPLVGYVYLL